MGRTIEAPLRVLTDGQNPIGYPDTPTFTRSDPPCVVRLGEVASRIVHGHWFDSGAPRRASHPIVVLIETVGLDFDGVESAKKYISAHRESNPSAGHISTFKLCKAGKIEVISN